MAFLLVCVLALSALPIGALAENVQTSNSIFNLTGVYGSQLHGNTFLQVDSSEQPTITVFTHKSKFAKKRQRQNGVAFCAFGKVTLFVCR